ncbi:hypothetical protein PATSB16_02820 [Pandoraea thiooxydans]|nr:hypothetical protein PATSB16_02820 [Pandoraea thiooxydans]
MPQILYVAAVSNYSRNCMAGMPARQWLQKCAMSAQPLPI